MGYGTDSQACTWSLYFKAQKYACYRIILKSLIKLYGKHTVYSDGGTQYPEVCDTLGREDKLHSQFERALEYVKDRKL